MKSANGMLPVITWNFPNVMSLRRVQAKRGRSSRQMPSRKSLISAEVMCRVNATAGSGKTECMTERGARMFEEGIKPSEVLFITFTDAGANEMKARIAKKCRDARTPCQRR